MENEQNNIKNNDTSIHEDDEALRIQKLLEQARQLKKQTRKPRADKGIQRGPNSKTRSDAGILRPHLSSLAPKELLTVYLIVKNRLFRSARNEDYNVYQDQDGFYIPREAPTKTTYKNYIVTHQGARIPRTVKHVQGKKIDLEQYRYQALQDKATLYPLEIIPEKYQQQLSQEIRRARATTWLDLFCNWYFLDETEVLTTSYQQWRDKHYGKPDEQDRLNKILLSKKYENEYAKVRDEEYSKVFEKMKIDAINDLSNAHMTMLQIEKLVRQQIKEQGLEEEMNQRVQERMDKWLDEQQEKER